MQVLNQKLMNPHIKIFTTLRTAGASEFTYSYFNLSYKTDDKMDFVKLNRDELVTKLDTKLFISDTTPNLDIRIVSHDDENIDDFDESMLVTYEKRNIALGTLHNDDLPIVISFLNKVTAIGLFNLDTLLNGAIEKLIGEITKGKIKPILLNAYLAPSLSFSHYEIDEKTKSAVIASGYAKAIKITNGINYLDLPLLATFKLIECGLSFRLIEISPYCTYEENDLFYSKRYSEGKTGKNMTVVSI